MDLYALIEATPDDQPIMKTVTAIKAAFRAQDPMGYAALADQLIDETLKREITNILGYRAATGRTTTAAPSPLAETA